MATRFVGLPHGAEFPSSNFPQLTQINQRPALAFDAATDETAYWTDVAPQGLTGTITVLIYYAMASATSVSTSSGERSRIAAASATVKSSSVVSSSACRAGGVIAPSRACAPASCSLVGVPLVVPTEPLAQTLPKAR